MATVETQVPPLAEGQRLSRDEFLRRWEAMPHVKRAELIKGVVHIMSSPLSMDHGDQDFDLGVWLGFYAVHTPGTKGNKASTHLMLTDAPQPDCHLRILPEAGGRTKRVGKYLEGGFEFVGEVSLSRASYDLGDKFDLYEEGGVLEYVVILVEEREIRWFHRHEGKLQPLPEPPDGVWRSRVFPGLWLNGPAFLAGDMAKVLATLNQGLQSAEHAAFVEELAKRITK
ncbi:MAG: Uma2 family endonuclease [Gemmataceae bacterium]|nr:Uma2 family endonuclease [Gemmataceae bacterium]